MQRESCSISFGKDFDKKFKAAKISPWVLYFNNGTGTMLTQTDVLNPDGGAPVYPLDWEGFITNVIHPDDQEMVRRSMQNVLDNPDLDYNVEYRIRSDKAHSWNWIFAFGTVDEANSDGSFIVRGGVQDIQERVENKRLREREHSLNTTLIGSLPASYLVVDMDRSILHWNSQFAETFLASPDALPPSQWTFIFDSDERLKVVTAVDAMQEGGTASLKVKAILANGEPGFFFCQCRRFLLEGEPRLLVLLFDITAAEQAQSRIVSQQSKLDTVVAAANLGIWDWNLATGDVIYNETWADILGYKLEVIQGSAQTMENVILPEDLPKADAALQAHIRGETEMYMASTVWPGLTAQYCGVLIKGG